MITINTIVIVAILVIYLAIATILIEIIKKD